MVKKTWCEGPLTVKVNRSPMIFTHIEDASLEKSVLQSASIIERMLMINFCR